MSTKKEDLFLSLKTILDTSCIGSADIAQIQKILDKYSVSIAVELDQTQLSNSIKQIFPQVIKEINKLSDTEIRFDIDDSLFEKTMEQIIDNFKKIIKELNTTAKEYANVQQQISKTNYINASSNEKSANTLITSILKDTAIKAVTTLLTKNKNAIEGLISAILPLLESNPIGWAIITIAAIASVTSKIIEFNKAIKKAREETIEAGQIATNTIKNIAATIRSNKKTVREAIDTYKKLMDGVDTLSNNNISLSNDEYTTFLDTNNQIADLFPELVAGIDDENNAILNLGKTAEEAASKLNNLSDAQTQRLINDIREEMPTTMNGIYEDTRSLRDDYNNLWKHGNGGAADVMADIGNSLSIYDKEYSLSENYLSGFDSQEFLTTVKDIINRELGTELEVEYKDLTHEYYINLAGLTAEELENVKTILASNMSELDEVYQTQLDRLAPDINAEYKKNLPSILLIESGNTDYQGLSDVNKQFANTLIQNLNYAQYADEINNKYQGDINKFIDDVILKDLYDASEESQQEIANIFSSLLEIDPNDSLADNIKVIDNYMQQLADLLGLDEDGKRQLEIALGFDTKHSQSLLDKAKKMISEAADDDVAAYLDTLSESELTLFVQSDKASEVKTQKELEQLIRHLKATSKVEIDTDLSSYLAQHESLKNKLIQLSKTGKLDETAIKSLAEYKKMLELCGNDSEKLINSINQFANQSSGSFDAANNLSGISHGLDALSEVYDQAINDGFVDSDSITGLYEQFGDLSVFDDFVTAMQNIGDEAYNTADAFDRLADAYINTNLPLDELTESTKKQYIEELKKHGITNAEIAIEERLAYVEGIRQQALASLAATQQFANITSQDLANATIAEINTMIDEVTAAGEDTSALNQLAIMKVKTTENQITEDTSIEEVLSLAKACGISTPMVNVYNTAKNTPGMPSSELEKIAKNTKQSVLDAIYDFDFGFTKYQYGGTGVHISSSGASEAKDTTKQYNWIETAINRVQETLSRLTKVRDDTYTSWTKRNTALNQEIAKTTEEINLQQRAYENYIAKANSISLSQDYINKIQAGTIQIEDITDKGLQEKIDQYQEWYNKAVSCSDAIQDLNLSLSQLAQQKFDNLQQEYDSLISTITAQADVINERMNRTEEQGYFADKTYYQQLTQYETQELAVLRQEYAALQSSLQDAVATGRITEGSQAWSDMKAEILSVEQAIEESTTALVKYNNAMRDLDWEIFDYIHDRIGQITQESDFLIDLLENSKLYEDNGTFNAEGKAAAALHGVNYNTYLQQSLDYAKELKNIESELAKDQNNRDLIDRREELLKLQQESIVNAEAEKEAIKSLVEDGINLHLEALSELIDKYKESLDAAKDLYDYQKNISQQTANIADLEKILMAYEGDDSEETRKRIQDTRNQLEEARQELQETEWDKYISETEDLLDTLYEDYETILNERLDNIDALIETMIEMVNASGSEIRDAISDTTAKVGYDITHTLDTIFGNGGKQTTLISSFMNKFETASTTLQTAINDIKNSIHAMMATPGVSESAGGTSNSVGSSSNASNGSVSGNAGSGAAQAAGQAQSASASPQGDGIASVGDLVTYISGKYHEDSWGNGRSGSQNLNGQVYITKIKAGSPYPYHISRGSTLGNGDLGWVSLDQLQGYKTGARRISNAQYAWLHEDGSELIRTSDGALLTRLGQGDMVFTNEMSQRLWEISKGMLPHSASTDVNLSNLLPYADRQKGVINNSNDITIQLPNVTNYAEFKRELQKDSKFAGFVQEITLGQASGKPRLNSNKY